MSLRTVAIIGRPNVGKSTLFNRIIGEKRSVVHETAGVTRDRISETTDWAGHPFILLDTGGIIPFGEQVSEFDTVVTEIARQAVDAADLVLFLVDGKVGPMAWDESIAKELRRKSKPVVLAVNKIEKDSEKLALSRVLQPRPGRPARHQRPARLRHRRPAGRGRGRLPAARGRGSPATAAWPSWAARTWARARC